MKQTPLQKVIKLIEDRMSLYPDNPSLSERGSYDAYLNILNEAKKLLPYEQECIENAVTYGNRQDCYDGTETLGEKYFAQTYTTSPIEFDAKKVAEEIYHSFDGVVVYQISEWRLFFNAVLSHSKYTPTQRQQILNELEKI